MKNKVVVVFDYTATERQYGSWAILKIQSDIVQKAMSSDVSGGFKLMLIE